MIAHLRIIALASACLTGISCSAIVDGILEPGDAAAHDVPDDSDSSETDGVTDDTILVDPQDTIESETPTCLPPLRVCGILCTDTGTDRLNCGDCGNACESPSFCEGGVCVCPSGVAGWLDCEGQCVETMTDPSNCGGCGIVCSSVQVCDGTGKCSGSCAEGFEMCTDASGGLYCADIGNDLFNCGACGRACGVYPHMRTVCSEGSCIDTCEDLWFNLDGQVENGCECYSYGEEVCDGVDDDCNGIADEGYECIGGTQQSCTLPESSCSGLVTCDSSSCTWSACSSDWWTCNSPGLNSTCTVSGTSCPGTQNCLADCTLSECQDTCTFDCCPSGCTNTLVDRNNCGDCENQCDTEESCIVGVCTGPDTSEDVVDDAPDTPDVPDIPDISDFPDDHD